ncbi:MAG: lactate racemase domain-containing protein [Chloroflexota bacterium]
MRIELDVPEAILHELLDEVPLPRMARVRYDPPTPPALVDVGAIVRAELDRPEIRDNFKPGQRIAIGVGSRGIRRLSDVVAATVDALRARGVDPIIVPAMGSHGGATADGQRRVLAHLGVTPDAMGAPVESEMKTQVVGHTESGVPVHLDAIAAGADGIIFIARVKPHTAFRGEYESGLVKMIAIGLGKQAGAALTHARGFGEMARMVPEMARVALKAAPILFGIAILENARDQPYKLVAVPASHILDDEPALLEEAKRAMPGLPFESLDVLVVDRIGKNISGDGADPNITGRYPTPYASGGPEVNKQVVLDLDDASGGNANGVGTADFTTVRLARKFNLGQTYPNALTSTVARPVALPMVLPSDRLALAAALLTCNAVDAAPTLVRISDTLHLDAFWISESLLERATQVPGLTVESEPEAMSFDAGGNFNDVAPDAVSDPVAPVTVTDTW